MSSTREFARQYWDLANYIVGFASVQKVAFLLALASQKEFASKVRNSWGTVFVLEIVFAALYCLGVFGCSRIEDELLTAAEIPEHPIRTRARQTRTARIIWLIFLLLLSSGAVLYIRYGPA